MMIVGGIVARLEQLEDEVTELLGSALATEATLTALSLFLARTDPNQAQILIEALDTAMLTIEDRESELSPRGRIAHGVARVRLDGLIESVGELRRVLGTLPQR